MYNCISLVQYGFKFWFHNGSILISRRKYPVLDDGYYCASLSGEILLTFTAVEWSVICEFFRGSLKHLACCIYCYRKSNWMVSHQQCEFFHVSLNHLMSSICSHIGKSNCPILSFWSHSEKSWMVYITSMGSFMLLQMTYCRAFVATLHYGLFSLQHEGIGPFLVQFVTIILPKTYWWGNYITFEEKCWWFQYNRVKTT